ncbi:hypothetical protein CTA2_11629 [Colletotrichum tanaceti]|uniref:Uncharacterized protein n=1 Tax=Colletotrichum tanaceti TaxID=1306861 RepID=A0A4U6XBT4_9PEZI|nr:hypothetical protein CTA2_11629 [Colletotrichum tanaceti]TKW52844.1 hypothetical protein CTA1_12572 [Colletotrichum tanaceti]
MFRGKPTNYITKPNDRRRHISLSTTCSASQEIMAFPSEIVDQILCAYIVDKPFGRVRYDGSPNSWQDGSPDAWEDFTASSGRHTVGVWNGRQYYETKFYRKDVCDAESFTSLLKCRSVSRQWDFSVCRLLQKLQWWNLHLDKNNTFQRATSCIEGGSSGSLKLIRNLCLDEMTDLRTFSRIYSYDNEDVSGFEGQEIDDDDILLNSYVDQLAAVDRRSTRTDFELHYDKGEELGLLRRLFDKLTNVERFRVAFPGAESEHGLQAQCYDMQGVDEVIATVQYGLKSPALHHLVDLSLSLPSTWHVGRLGSALSQDARDRLAHLQLVIVDETGPSGSLKYTLGEDGNDNGDLTSVLDSGYAPSNIQVAYPNREHQEELWRFVASCRNLESLAIEATHYLQLEQLNWSPALGSRGLQNVSLRRVWANVPSIRRLLSASSGSKMSPAIRRVVLDDVKIYADGGNWEVVFKHLRANCPDLELVRAEQLSYFSEHPRFAHNNRPWENVANVWTADNVEDNDDVTYLHMLHKMLVQRSGSSSRGYPVCLYDCESEGEEW